MKKSKLLSLIVITAILGCSSNDNDCTKTITIPGQTIITSSGSTYIPSYQQEVPCDYVVTPIQEQMPLENFNYEVIDFTFIPDTGNNTNKLKFDIKLNNPNNFNIKGFAYITINTDGNLSSSAFRTGAASTCDEIEANSSCIFSYEGEGSLDIVFIQSIQLVDVKYYLED